MRAPFTLWVGLALCAAPVAAAQDWSDFRLRRSLPPDETERLRQRLAAWIARPGVPELQELGPRTRLKSAEERPLYRVAIETLEEDRRLERIKRPHAGGNVPPPSVRDADVWAPATPSFTGFEARHWRLPVPGSEEVKPCTACEGKGVMLCKPCGGDGWADCSRCKGEGEVACATCEGTGLKACKNCGLGGKPEGENLCKDCKEVRDPCGDCKFGKLLCPACAGLRTVPCQGCRRQGKFACGPCTGKGRILEALEILIAINPRRAELDLTALDRKWTARVAVPDSGWTPAITQGLDAAVRQIPDEAIREFILDGVAAEKRASGKKPVRGQRVSVRRLPVTFVAYDAGGTAYEAVAAADTFVCFESPVMKWLGEKVDAAQRLLAAGKVAEALETARLALKVEPQCPPALDIVKEAERHPRTSSPKPVASPAPQPVQRPIDPGRSAGPSDQTCVFLFGGFAVLVIAVAVYGLKLAMDR